MKRIALGSAVAVVLLTALAFGQAAEQYLDVYIAQVKPDKRADFDALNKRMVAANRQNKGDTWITMETMYGPANRVTFISTRDGYADVEKGMDAFEGALQKALGKTATDKMMQEYSQCLVSVRTELRRRRWDLSSNAPADAAAMSKMLGESRWLRTATVRVKPGQVAVFEGLLKDLKTAREKASPPVTTLVSQAVAGQEGTVFYITLLEKSLAGFEGIPSVQQLLGDEGYAKYLKTNADVVDRTETVINRFLPELSNVPEQVAAASPDYWTPKPVVAAKSKPAGGMTNAAEANKMGDKDKH